MRTNLINQEDRESIPQMNVQEGYSRQTTSPIATSSRIDRNYDALNQ
jgi:hypothetical protein